MPRVGYPGRAGHLTQGFQQAAFFVEKICYMINLDVQCNSITSHLLRLISFMLTGKELCNDGVLRFTALYRYTSEVSGRYPHAA